MRIVRSVSTLSGLSADFTGPRSSSHQPLLPEPEFWPDAFIAVKWSFCDWLSVTASITVNLSPRAPLPSLDDAPPPDGAVGIVREFPFAAIERFGDPTLVAVGVECLHVARVPDAVETIARAVFVDDVMTYGDLHALEGAVASCWWCALRSARLRNVDPIAEAAAICRYVARVA